MTAPGGTLATNPRRASKSSPSYDRGRASALAACPCAAGAAAAASRIRGSRRGLSMTSPRPEQQQPPAAAAPGLPAPTPTARPPPHSRRIRPSRRYRGRGRPCRPRPLSPNRPQRRRGGRSPGSRGWRAPPRPPAPPCAAAPSPSGADPPAPPPAETGSVTKPGMRGGGRKPTKCARTYTLGKVVGPLLGGAGDGALGEEARAEEVDGHGRRRVRRHPHCRTRVVECSGLVSKAARPRRASSIVNAHRGMPASLSAFFSSQVSGGS